MTTPRKPPQSPDEPSILPRWMRLSARGKTIRNGLLWAIAMPIPFFLALMGTWIGSTLAIYHDGPVWLALIGALVVFAALPYLWELAVDAHQVGGRVRDAILRSSFLSILLIAVLLLTHAKTTYVALATRGDWFLAESRTPAADSIRGFMFRMADRFQWLDTWTRDFSYAWAGTTEGVDPSSSAVALGSFLRSSAINANLKSRATKPEGFLIPGTTHRWPLPSGVHPLVMLMPADVKTSYESVAEYLKTNIPDEFMRAKAVHDFVASWVVYDHAGLLADTAFSNGHQSAAMVFKRRLGVCAGYANLTSAMGNAAGIETVVVSGPIRWNSDYGLMSAEDVEGGEFKLAAGDTRSHAWNAMKVNGHWHLVDTTWDKSDATRGVQSTYLFIPPEVMLADHFPDDSEWQLLTTPKTYGDWLRSPNLDPHAFLHGIRVLNHLRPVAKHTPTFRLEVANPYHLDISVGLRDEKFASLRDVANAKVNGVTSVQSTLNKRCGIGANTEITVIECTAPNQRFAAHIWAKRPENGADVWLGQVSVEAP